MQKSRQAVREVRRSVRGAFTLLEFVVTIGIIAILMSLIMPAVMRARATARRLTCQNHLRQIGLAVTQFGDHQNRYPASGMFSATGRRVISVGCCRCCPIWNRSRCLKNGI